MRTKSKQLKELATLLNEVCVRVMQICTSRLTEKIRGGSRISKGGGGGVDGRPYLLRGARENALTKKIGNNFSCTCLRRVF